MNWLTRVLGRRPPTERPAGQDSPEDLVRRGYECEVRGDAVQAERLYRLALERGAGCADALYFLGGLAVRDRRLEEALALYRQAVELRPGEVIYLCNLGFTLLQARHYEEAIDIHRAALAVLPECIELRVNYTVPLIELGRREEALVELERVLEMAPRVPTVYFNLAGIYREYGRTDDAIATYRRARALMPDHVATHSNLLLEMNYSSSLDARAIFEEHLRFGERFARRYVAPAPDLAWPRRLRVGYVSPDFRHHVVMHFMEPVLANHDRAAFEIFCYHTHPDHDSATERVRRLAVLVSCHDLSESELAERIRADRIDLLVDLAGHTAGNSLPVLATKPAPVQATYLGYPNTTGLGAVDYRITDAFADPPGEADRFSVEKLVRLPGSYFCYRPSAKTPPVSPPPAERSGIVTFGCFNNFAKLSESFLETAARLLQRVPGSRFVLKGRPLSIDRVAASVRERFSRAGIEPDRLVLRGWAADPLEPYAEVDIALDSFPYNGATTTCEALWMGVPVVTLLCDRHAGRVGSSLLNAVRLGDLVAHSVDEYLDIAARLAGDPARRAELRRDLRETLRRSPIMDEEGFTRRLEACYRELWQIRRSADLRVEGAAGEPHEETLARAGALRAAGDLHGARVLCERILRSEAGQTGALEMLWNIAFDSGTPGAAADWLNRAAAANPDAAAVHYMLGCVLQAQGRLGDALGELSRALELAPRHAKAHNNLGCVLETAGDLGAAAAHYEEAIRVDPVLAQALYNLGNACKQMGDSGRALEMIGRALAVEPGHADWLGSLGSVLYTRGDWDGAIGAFDDAIALDPASAQHHRGLATATLVTGEVERATAAMRRALEIDPNAADVESCLLLTRHYREEESPEALFEGHLAWARRHARGLQRATTYPARTGGERLNVGYVSMPREEGARARLIGGIFTGHDRARFRVFAYATDAMHDSVRRRMIEASDHWRDLFRLSDFDLADQIRADAIDILIDLAGHSGGGKLQLFARKPAATQVSWLGYPDTSGLDAMDFRLTDAVADPPGLTERFGTETLYRLPGGFVCYVPPAECPEVAASPAAGARPVTYGCCTELAAVTPRMVGLWCEILRARPDARLVLRAPGIGAISATRRLREQLQAGGIEPARVDGIEDTAADARLRGYAGIDIGLDVHPRNGVEATCEALWMGVPVVSLAGSTHASRIGASILGNAGLGSLVAQTPQQYVEIALRLASQREELRAMRAGMRARLRSTPLVDIGRFTRLLEEALHRMHYRDAPPRREA